MKIPSRLLRPPAPCATLRIPNDARRRWPRVLVRRNVHASCPSARRSPHPQSGRRPALLRLHSPAPRRSKRLRLSGLHSLHLPLPGLLPAGGAGPPGTGGGLSGPGLRRRILPVRAQRRGRLRADSRGTRSRSLIPGRWTQRRAPSLRPCSLSPRIRFKA